MPDMTDLLKTQYRSQLGLLHEVGALALGCYERLTAINYEAAEKWLAELDANRDSLLSGEGSGLLASAGRIALDQWGAAVACGTEFQRQVLAGMAKR